MAIEPVNDGNSTPCVGATNECFTSRLICRKCTFRFGEIVLAAAKFYCRCTGRLTVGTYGGSTFFAAKRSQSMPARYARGGKYRMSLVVMILPPCSHFLQVRSTFECLRYIVRALAFISGCCTGDTRAELRTAGVARPKRLAGMPV